MKFYSNDDEHNDKYFPESVGQFGLCYDMDIMWNIMPYVIEYIDICQWSKIDHYYSE